MPIIKFSDSVILTLQENLKLPTVHMKKYDDWV